MKTAKTPVQMPPTRSRSGAAFSDRRKSASAATIADIIFTKLNVE